jgi:nucleoside-diphosphate-sugar epimerase
MEVYGYPEKGRKVRESYSGAVDSLNVRSSYPLSKKMCENICVSYAAEYGVPARIIRLTQTFGAGVKQGDKRIFGYLADCAYKGEEIVLKTKGETERDYLYTADAITAILTVMLSGKDGEAYNAADEGTYCSIAEMAGAVSEKWGTGLRVEAADAAKSGFLDTLYMDLDTSKLKSLGWQVKDGGRSITGMFERMIRDF